MLPGLRGEAPGEISLIVTLFPAISLAVASGRWFLRRAINHQTNAPRRRPNPSVTPTPMPAFAPAERPVDFWKVMIFVAMDPPEPVRTTELVDGPPAQRSVPLKAVHVAPLLQHPPPSAEGQLNWFVKHPVGDTDATDVVGFAVDIHRALVPIMLHVESTEQQPPPNTEAHLKAFDAEQALEQQLAVDDADPLIVVITLQRTRSVAQGSDAH